MVYHFMFRDNPVADVTTDEKNMVISITKFIPDSPKQLFWGDFTNATPQMMTKRLYTILKSRCYEDGRADLEKILKQAGMKTNNPYEWAHVCHCVMYEDDFWVRFDDEKITWDDVKVR